MNVILVTRDSVYGRYFAASLHAAARLDRILIETGHPSGRFYWRKLLRVGPVNALFGFWYNRWFLREGARHLPSLALPPHETLVTVNTYPFGDDDLVLGFGTGYITARTLGRMRNGFLNLHTGWLPEYRGVKSEFWVLLYGDLPRAGWTLHYMTPRLDEGDIVLQQTVPAEGANPAELRARLLQDAVPAIAELIAQVRERGVAAISRRPQVNGRYFTTPTWREWLAYRRQQGAPRDHHPASLER